MYSSDRSARHGRTERGQTLITFVLALGVLMGMVAMSVDVGLFFQSRRHLQNASDAMALAGAQELPLNPISAKQKAKDWAANNGVTAAQINTLEVRTTQFPNDTLYVELKTDFNWIFARVLGKVTAPVGADAAAQVGSLSGGHNMMPWSILQGDSNCLDALGKAIFGATCSVKLGAQSKFGGGWRGALTFDGQPGANQYRNNIITGHANTFYCIDGQVVPPCQTSIIDIEPGNIVGPSAQGIQGRLAQGPKCDANSNGKDDFEEVFKPTGQVSPAYSVACPNSPWLLIIPIVSLNSDGKTVTIRGWALAYFLKYDCIPNANCNGNGQMEVQVRIADAAYSQSAGFLGAYDPAAGITVRRLIE